MRTGQLVQRQRRVAGLALEELERRFLGEPENVSSRDLIVAAGVVTDKALAFERQQGNEGYSFSALDRLAGPRRQIKQPFFCKSVEATSRYSLSMTR